MSKNKIINFELFDDEIIETDNVISLSSSDSVSDNHSDSHDNIGGYHMNLHNNIFYVRYEDLDLDRIRVIEGKNDRDRNCKYFSIKYKFGDIEKDLVILFKDIKLEQSSYKIINNLRYNYLPIDQDDKFLEKIDDIREHIMKQLRKIIKTKRVSLNKNNISLKHYNKLSQIIKLGMANENYKNVSQDKKDFEDSLTNYRYNKIKSDRYYIASTLITFNALHYNLDKRFTCVSIKQCSKFLEYRFVKQSYNSTIIVDRRDNTPIKSIVSF